MEIKGIKYVAPFFDNSGYAQASRGYVMALYKLGVPLTVLPISFEDNSPNLGETGKIIRSLVDNKIDYNIVIIHTTPEFWSRYKEANKLNIGYTVWETTKLHPDWIKFIDKDVEVCMVPCEWNVKVFKESGVDIPVYTIPHTVDMSEYDNVVPFSVGGVDPDAYKFYSIFQFCYDKETRVLTIDGFKYFKDLNYDDEIATLNLKTEELEYQKPTNIVKFKRNDKMLSLQGSFFNMCVTPDHKMVVRNKKEDTWSLIPFNELLSRGRAGKLIVSDNYRAKKNCKWVGEDIPIFKVPLLEDAKYPIRNGAITEIDMDCFLEFMGWYLSEGSTCKAVRGYRNIITQCKEEYRSEIIACIEKMGYNVITTSKDIIFYSREFYYYLKQFGKCNKKFIPKWIKNLSSRQISILLNSLFKGDGSLYENGDWVKYTTTSKQLAEDVQECLLKVGMSGSVSIEDPNLKEYGDIDGRKVCGKLLQYVVFVNHYCNEPSMYYANLEEIDYDDYIYCATVPNHAMLVERNGKVVFSGNTERKNPMSLVKSYWAAFQNNENVALILKTYRSNYSENEVNAVKNTLKRIKDVMIMDRYPPIYLISHMLSRDEILGLHKFGDCYVSLDRGEGWGISGAEAGAVSNPIMITGFGGALEYAKENNSYLINYTLTPCSGMAWTPWYRGDQMWAEPDCGHAIETFRHIYNNKNEANMRGMLLHKYIEDNFTWDRVGQLMLNSIVNL